MLKNYLAGGAEYILSRGAIELMAEQGLTDNEMCSFDNTLPEYEEISMEAHTFIWVIFIFSECTGKCLKNLGVVNGDARDEEGKSRFYAFIPNRKPFPLVQDLNDHQWYWKYIFFESTDVEVKRFSDYWWEIYVVKFKFFFRNGLAAHHRPFLFIMWNRMICALWSIWYTNCGRTVWWRTVSRCHRSIRNETC